MGTTQSSSNEHNKKIKQLDKDGDIFEIISLTDSSVTYTACISKNTCTCPSWRYRRNGFPTCKHLDMLRPPINKNSSLVTFVKKKSNESKKCTHFHIISSYLPKFATLSDYVYGHKYDGIRIRFRISDGIATTRKGGMRIDISSILKNVKHHQEDNDPEFDAELIYHHNSTHDTVMKELMKSTVSKLTIKVFDIIDTKEIFSDRIKQIPNYFPDPLCVKYHDAKHYSHLLDILLVCKTKQQEGIVVRHINGKYTPGRSSNVNAFKIRVNNKKHQITSEYTSL